MRTDYVDSMWTRLYEVENRDSKRYRYSDLGFYLLMKVVENVTNQSFDEYVQTNFYGPLGLKKTMFNPYKSVEMEEIVPSEQDYYFRRGIVHGYVHDMGAAMLGGVCGHAGLFSNASELATIMQMLANEGSYGGLQVFKPETVQLFTSRFYRSSRRCIGFDCKETNENRTLNTAELASSFTFGHSGFTGTCTWVDPSLNLVYVFLSNRTYPKMSNNRLHRENYRTKIQNMVYESIIGLSD
jgi:CubicO group peptidase (beta-lactamase class C family)